MIRSVIYHQSAWTSVRWQKTVSPRDSVCQKRQWLRHQDCWLGMMAGRDLPLAYHAMYGWLIWQEYLQEHPAKGCLPSWITIERGWDESKASNPESNSIIGRKLTDKPCNTDEEARRNIGNMARHVQAHILIQNDKRDLECRQSWLFQIDSAWLTITVHFNFLMFFIDFWYMELLPFASCV